MDGWMDGWMDGRMDGWMDGWMDPLWLRKITKNLHIPADYMYSFRMLGKKIKNVYLKIYFRYTIVRTSSTGNSVLRDLTLN